MDKFPSSPDLTSVQAARTEQPAPRIDSREQPVLPIDSSLGSHAWQDDSFALSGFAHLSAQEYQEKFPSYLFRPTSQKMMHLAAVDFSAIAVSRQAYITYSINNSKDYQDYQALAHLQPEALAALLVELKVLKPAIVQALHTHGYPYQSLLRQLRPLFSVPGWQYIQSHSPLMAQNPTINLRQAEKGAKDIADTTAEIQAHACAHQAEQANLAQQAQPEPAQATEQTQTTEQAPESVSASTSESTQNSPASAPADNVSPTQADRAVRETTERRALARLVVELSKTFDFTSFLEDKVAPAAYRLLQERDDEGNVLSESVIENVNFAEDTGLPAEASPEAAKLMQERFRGFCPIVIDVETTGLQPKRTSITQIGAVALTFNQDGKLVPYAAMRVNVHPLPENEVLHDSVLITGINPFDPERKAVSITTALQALGTFARRAQKAHGCKRSIITAHNSPFDFGYVMHYYERMNVKRCPFHPFVQFDTSGLATIFLGDNRLSECTAKLHKAMALQDPQRKQEFSVDALAQGRQVPTAQSSPQLETLPVTDADARYFASLDFTGADTSYDHQQAHDALYDAQLCAQLFCFCVNQVNDMAFAFARLDSADEVQEA